MIEIIAFVVVVAVIAYLALKATNDLALLTQPRVTPEEIPLHGRHAQKHGKPTSAIEARRLVEGDGARTSATREPLVTAEDVHFKAETATKLSTLETDVHELRKRVNNYELSGVGVDATLEDVVDEIEDIRKDTAYLQTQAAVELQELKDKVESLEKQLSN